MGKGDRLEAASDIAIAYLHGRIDTQIEQFCVTTGISLDEASQRIAFLLHPMGQGVQDSVLAVSLGRTQGNLQLPEVEGTGNSHGAGTHPKTKQEALPAPVKRRKNKKPHLTPEGRAKIIKSVKAMWARRRKAAKAAA